jgi:hypothetical protein
VDFEKGGSSIDVSVIRDGGESKDCDRMRTLGEGVRRGGSIVAMLMFVKQETNNKLNKGGKRKEDRLERWPDD